MTDKAFMNELHIRAYKDQVDGYPLGHPGRANFVPIISSIQDRAGTVNREATLDSACYKFSDGERMLLLNTTEDWRTALKECRDLGADV